MTDVTLCSGFDSLNTVINLCELKSTSHGGALKAHLRNCVHLMKNTMLLQLGWICDLLRRAYVLQVWDGAESGRCLKVYTCHLGAVRDACWTPCGRHLLTGSFDNSAVITDVETGEPRHIRLSF